MPLHQSVWKSMAEFQKRYNLASVLQGSSGSGSHSFSGLQGVELGCTLFFESVRMGKMALNHFCK